MKIVSAVNTDFILIVFALNFERCLALHIQTHSLCYVQALQEELRLDGRRPYDFRKVKFSVSTRYKYSVIFVH